MMSRRPLGRSGLNVAPLAFGGNVFGWTADEATSFALLDAFVDAGFNLVDTADVYSRWAPGHSGGESEAVIGRWLKATGKRDRIVLATKVGMDMGGSHKGLSPAWIRQSVEDSLRRLQTDRIDLYQSHTFDDDTPIEDTLGAYADLIREGKVRAIGASNYNTERLQRALEASARHGLPRYETLQPHFNLVDRGPYERPQADDLRRPPPEGVSKLGSGPAFAQEGSLQALCVREGLGVINFFGLARGFLTGKYRSESDLSKSPRGAGVKTAYFNERGWRILAQVDAVAQRFKATPAQVALAWQMRQPGITAPIASATSIAQFNELAVAAHLQLDDEAMASLDQSSQLTD